MTEPLGVAPIREGNAGSSCPALPLRGSGGTKGGGEGVSFSLPVSAGFGAAAPSNPNLNPPAPVRGRLMNNDTGLCPETGGRLNDTKLLLLIVSLSAAIWMAVACGMVAGAQAPAGGTAVSESPTQPLPVLLPISLEAVTRPPANGFEYALEQSTWGVNDWSIIRSIVQCESGFRETVVGRAGEVGALQIHPVHDLAHQFNLWTYEGSLAAAAVVHEEAGGSFEPWSCFGGAR